MKTEPAAAAAVRTAPPPEPTQHLYHGCQEGAPKRRAWCGHLHGGKFDVWTGTEAAETCVVCLELRATWVCPVCKQRASLF